MLTEEEVMEVEISLDFDDFCFNEQFYNPFDLKEIVDNSVKKYGLASNMIRLEEYSSLRVLNEFFDSYHEEMKDEKFAKQAYNFAQHYFTKDEFEKFVNLRKPYKDAFYPENEHAPER